MDARGAEHHACLREAHASAQITRICMSQLVTLGAAGRRHNGGTCVLTVTSDRDAALSLLKSVSELIADNFAAGVRATAEDVERRASSSARIPSPATGWKFRSAGRQLEAHDDHCVAVRGSVAETHD